MRLAVNARLRGSHARRGAGVAPGDEAPGFELTDTEDVARQGVPMVFSLANADASALQSALRTAYTQRGTDRELLVRSTVDAEDFAAFQRAFTGP